MSAGRPRILLADSYPEALYGQQHTLLQLLRASPRDRLEPILLTPGPGDLPDRVAEMGVAVEAAPYPDSLAAYGGAIYRYRPSRRLRLAWQWLSYVATLRGVLRRLRIDAVYCNDLRALLTVGFAARSLGVPTLIWDKLNRPHGILDAVQLPLASRNLVLASAITEKYPRWQRRLLAGRIKVVRDGIDMRAIAAGCSIRPALGVGEDSVVFAMIGTISKRKGQAGVLQAFTQVMKTREGVHLLVVGEPATDHDQRHAAEIRPIGTERATWLGYRDDIPDVLASVDVLVVNSDDEGGPRVVMEAMAAGKVVIATPVGYVPEVITHRFNGFIVPRDDIHCLRQVMTELITDENLRGRLGDAARATAVREFDCVEHSRNVIDELVALAARAST